MRITALQPLVRGLHTSRTACNAASTSTSSAEPISTGSADASKAADAVQVTESGRRDIESARSDQSGKKSSSKQRSSKAPAPKISLDILTEDISMLLPEGTAAPAPSSAGSRRSRSTPHSSGERAQGGPSGERSSRPRDRSDRHAQGDRGRERDQQSQQYQGQRRPRAGAVQRAAARSSPRAASGSSSSFGDLEMQDNRPRGRQAVEPIEFDTSFKALFGRSNLVGAASASASRASKKGQGAETSDWAVQRGMKADQARREEILRAAGAYLSETPTAAFPSTLPAKTPAPQRARAVAQWTMAMNPSINIAAQRQAGKVFDAFLK